MLAASFAAAPSAARAAAPSVDAVIEPAEITLGESARLTVTMTGNGTLSVNLPVITGLELRVVGQSRQLQIINGVTLENSSTIIRVTPETAGTFKIPGFTPNSSPLVLRVNPAGNGPPALPNNGAPPSILPPLGGTAPNGIRLTPDGSAFIRVAIPKRDVYVGESVPVEIELGMRDGFVASINGPPKLSSNDFTLNNLSHQPERGGRMIEGKPFSVLTWRSILAPVKPGKFSLTFEAPLTVRIRTRPRSDSLLDDMLGDPFLQNIFGATVPKNITVTSPESPLTVLPLPAEGRPSDFGGAVGSFKVSADISSATNTAGDPLTLRLHVAGTGNFDRVQSPVLASDEHWKTYDPKASFKAQDPIGFRGEKTFEQPVVASKSGALTIPSLPFTYFDPELRRYETARTEPLRVTVAPSAAETAANGMPPPNAGAPTDAERSGLRPDHAQTAARVKSLAPPYFQAGLIAIPSALALLFAAAWIALRRRDRIAGDLERARAQARQQRIEELLERMDTAAAAGDAAPYLRAARAALQEALGERWSAAPTDINLGDLDTRLEDDPDQDAIRQIFALTDEANYSGREIEAKDFDRWTETVRRQLKPESTA